MIDFFEKEYRFLSNFYSCPVVYNGVRYRNSEAAFQAQKNPTPQNIANFSIMNPSQAKKMGRSIALREDWDSVKDKIMYEIVLRKFYQNPDLREKLFATGDEYLEEGTWWHDNYWGNCHCKKCENIQGQNHLGIILMKVREKLKHV